MPEQTKLPILGKTNKTTVIAAVAAIVAMGGYVVYKYEKNKASKSTATSTTSTGAAANAYGYAGYGYNSGYYGYGFGYGNTGSVGEVPSEWYYGYGEYGYGYYNSETGAYEGPASGSSAPSSATPTTNAEWATVATSDLVNEGYSSTSVTAALGAYLAGAELTSAQVTIVQAAIALTGQPPVAAATGYPPAYHQQGSTSSQGGSTNPAYAAPTNLHSTTYTTKADLAWNNPGNQQTLQCHVQVLQNGQNVTDSGSTNGHFSATGLKKNTTYQWRVAVDADSTHQASSWATATFKTKS